MSKQTCRGACLCGGVKFMFELPTAFCGHCHCTMCQRANGAGFVTWIGVKKEGFQFTAGETLLTTYQSSSEGTRTFCGVCGSSMFCELKAHPDIIDITLANVIDPIDKAPSAHFHHDTHVSWLSSDQALPVYTPES